MTCSLPINMASYQIDSPPTQLLTCLDDWISSIASKKSCYIVYLDFQKAFDTVCYSKLLCNLESFGITGPLLTWIEEYLSGRSQRVCTGEAVSDSVPVTSEIIQGSILGPLYTSPLPSSSSSTTSWTPSPKYPALPLLMMPSSILMTQPSSSNPSPRWRSCATSGNSPFLLRNVQSCVSFVVYLCSSSCNM